jgi:signal recognition particle subunit SRP54
LRPEVNARQRYAPSGVKVFGDCYPASSGNEEVVIPREGGGSSIPEASRFEPRSRGVLDAPVKPGHDSGERGNPARAGQGTTALFDNLSERLGGILDRLTGRGALTEKDVDAAMREVRRALLEADVALEVVRSFTERVREQAIGATVVKSVTPGQMVVKIVHDELINTLGAESQTIDINSVPPVPIMMVGLQGSGKTTTTAKLARRLVQRDKRKVLMASLDIYRPAAMEQLAVLGRDLDIPTLPIVAGQQPAQIAKRALEAGKLGGYDVVLLDTAGRTTLDEDMMAEAAAIKAAANPHEVLLVADSLTGQDAVNLARAFDERVGLTGIVLTRVDGDGRGGAALSMRAVTGKPIKLIGTGEKTDALEDFHPDRIAGRILGMGDVVSLVERAAANIDAEKAARTAERMRKGQFDLNDMREQLSQMANMGGISGLMGMMPGIAKMKNQIAAAGIDDKILKRQVAVIDSMTRDERRHPDLLKASRKKRIAAGSGQSVEQVNKLLKMHRNMADMMKAMGSGKRGPLAGIAQAMGFGGGMKPPSPEEMKALQDKMQGGGGQGLPSLPKDLPAGLRTGLPNVPGLTGLSGKPMLPGLGGFPGKKK